MRKFIFLMFLAALPTQVPGRLMKDWSFQEMFAKADLVVIATTIATFETTEHSTLTELSPPVAVLGLNTEFRVRLLLKGDRKIETFVLHHYKLEHQEPMISGPELVSFDSKRWTSYLLFLVRERDGRYAPVTGQTDPALYSVIGLQSDAQ